MKEIYLAGGCFRACRNSLTSSKVYFRQKSGMPTAPNTRINTRHLMRKSAVTADMQRLSK